TPALCEQPPWLGVAETKVTPVGRSSSSATFVAAAGPAFPTVSVYVRLLPATTGFGEALLLSDTSAELTGATVVVTDAVLFTGLASASLPPTVAAFVTVPPVEVFATMVTVVEPPTASPERLHVTVPESWTQLPCVEVAETNVSAPGSASVTTTP